MAAWDEYVWIVVVGALAAFFMAYGIGANDVANAFATSVGSRTLTLAQAVLLAAIFEFGGAVLLGRGVTSTVKDGIVDAECYEATPQVIMFGMLCALLSAGSWLLVATYFEYPVSTTHSIIGAIVGWGLVAGGGDCVTWYEYDDSEIFPVGGITAVVMSWILSPVCSGILAAFFFWVTRTLVLRHENSYNRSFWGFPALVFFTFFINAFYVLDKGISKQADLETAKSAWIAAIIGVGMGLLAIPATLWLKKRRAGIETREAEAIEAAEVGGGKVGEKTVADDGANRSSFFRAFGGIASAINANDPHDDYDNNEATRAIHDNAEVFDLRTENIFKNLQVLTACADSFAHGANDVANSVGPFAAIWDVYRNKALASKAEVPIWILVIGGFGIVVGLATFGYTIIRAIGVKLCKITPSRGFNIELGSALVVVTGSYLGLPLSTTHCQVGATTAVGLLEGRRGISYKVFGKALIGWVLTCIITGLLSALFFSFSIFAPNLNSARAINDLHQAIAEHNAAVTEYLTANCPGFAPLVVPVNELTYGTTEVGLGQQYPSRAGESLGYMMGLYTSATAPACPAGGFAPVPPELAAFGAEIPEPEEED